MVMLVLVIQSLVYREITQLFQGTRDPWSKTLNWYFFAIANYYFYGETIIYYFKVSGGGSRCWTDINELSVARCVL
jgi:phosphatidate cytidylyltransferase